VNVFYHLTAFHAKQFSCSQTLKDTTIPRGSKHQTSHTTIKISAPILMPHHGQQMDTIENPKSLKTLKPHGKAPFLSDPSPGGIRLKLTLVSLEFFQLVAKSWRDWVTV